MLKNNVDLLIQLLRDPHQAKRFSLKDWDLIIRQARVARLLGSLQNYFRDINDVPEPARWHIQAAERQAAQVAISTQWEISIIAKLIGDLDYPVIALKGGAYVLRHLYCSRGRIFSDLDLLVPQENIEAFEKLLLANGWKGEKLDSYDQQYYRFWMHELPPLTNTQTGSSLDLHHNILPPTSHIKVDVNRFIEKVVPVDGYKNFYTFSNEDMVLHSLTHLFHEGEFEHGLRGVVDLDLLLRQFSKDNPSFWSTLYDRAETHELQQPLYYALRYAKRFLQTPIPDSLLKLSESGAPVFPAMMDFFFTRALRPDHMSCSDSFTAFARFGLYVRSHYLKMPLHLLVPHLVRKAYMKRVDNKDTSLA